jgi:hypothetical protein
VIADADAGREPTEAEVEADKALATKVAVGFLTGLASLAGAGGVVVAAAFAPVAEAIATWAVRKVGRRRVDHAAETVMDGAEAAGIPLEEFIDRGVADDRRHELFARTLTIAQDTALRNKRRALGRALAAGVMGDNARIDEELLFIRAVADIDELHIRVLARMREAADRGVSRQTADTLRGLDPGLGPSVEALLATLQLHALIAEELGEPQGPFGYQRPFLVITDTGRRFLDRLADDSD